MGLFDSFKKKTTLEFTNEVQAISTLMLSIASLDGELDSSEVHALIGIGAINPMLNPDSLEAGFNFAVKYIQRNGPEQSAVDAFTYLPEDNHETAFSYACLVAMADGVVTEEEEQTLTELAEVSAIEDEDVHRIIQTCTGIMRPIG